MARTIIEQLRYISTRDEMMRSFKGKYKLDDLPALYFRMSVIMRLFMGEDIGKI